MSSTTKALYTPLSLAASVGGGLLAGAAFRRVWSAIGDDQRPPPDPKDLTRSTREALLGAALQGFVFALVRAAVDRGTAVGYRALTDESPT